MSNLLSDKEALSRIDEIKLATELICYSFSLYLKDYEGVGEITRKTLDDSVIYTFQVGKTRRCGRWPFLWEKTVRRNVLRITGAVIPKPQEDVFGGDRRYDSKGPLKCELFSDNPHLREIAQCFLESLAKRFYYDGVEYIDMFCDPSAWYPGERPELPKVRLLK
ncbi:MAG: hypothetical protein A2534_00795 [Candidatus Magasanikbacteria bacterium RIFOXYD2_FULL_39_9]|uniref:Uncharacterized protein n=1 Tax=Candidatus Magasanikbacteria bacterium RIFOXYD1_FULL_40_23 TaxID=1798705 RepID=A0A1F6PB47_9BACT|nr:MAG: hypothetical protein A2534_00795 [Candidatus Magasanikbacteria bacterium RIFOXYD2_FULL_39_9]OGH93382.1 MAG: hypothetical protein A2563_02110 [Candidatus Magasanikbacteria bacterium RIFOXYD1_FULL_40_23]